MTPERPHPPPSPDDLQRRSTPLNAVERRPGEESLVGALERIVFANEENGWTVARLKVPRDRELVTIVGPLVGATPGEHLSLTGSWVNDPKFGRQFKFRSFATTRPTTLVGIEKYLGSGLIHGVGEVYAARLVEAFGLETLHVIEQTPERLRSVRGIGPKRAERILSAWSEQKVVREVMIFLQGHGVTTGPAARIFKAYGAESLRILGENPYRMVQDVWGIGFQTADKIALKLGLSEQAPQRARAGLAWVLQDMLEDGHCYCPRVELLARAAEALRIDLDILDRALAETLREGLVIDDDSRIYLGAVYHVECKVADTLRRLAAAASGLPRIRVNEALAWVQQQLAIRLASPQEEAVRRLLQSKVAVLTGGPGVGKTTIVTAVLKIVRAKGARVALCAPTGKAAKRLSEVTGAPASTIHRLLKFRPGKGGFEFDAQHPLDTDLVVVDESSMVDLFLFQSLLLALPLRAGLLLVGDVDQLPSVGAGNCLRDVIDSGAVPVLRLTEVFRQAASSAIVLNAHRINRGELPELAAPPGGETSDFYFIDEEDPERIPGLVIKLIKERIPARFGLDPVRDIQVLTPMYRGAAGANNLNVALQAALTPAGGPHLTRFGREYRVGDKLMQLRNNYDKEVWNGDIGIVAAVDVEGGKLVLDVDGRALEYATLDLDEVTHAYAVSVHKAQGSEYPAVVLPMLTQHFILLQRNLLYTALTRAKRLAVIVGTVKALAIAVKNDKPVQRYTGLKERLAGAPAPAKAPPRP